MDKIPVGVSECLLGEPVRYDGGHKRNTYLTDVLQDFFEFRPYCPEVAVGLGIPREPIRIIATESGSRVRGRRDQNLDVTDDLAREADVIAGRWPDLCGYIFMQKSPSCGAFAMKRYDQEGRLVDTHGRGAFAGRLMDLMPLLPVEEAGRLNDPDLRNNFISRVFTAYDWQQSVAKNPSAGALIQFYSRYKYQVMAHHQPSYRAIGKLLADLSERDINQVCREFLALFMGALSRVATRSGNINAINHLRGYLKSQLQPVDKQELSQTVEAYGRGEVPLIVPLTLLKHHLLKVDDPYLQQQSFWSPHPAQLGLRNNISAFR